jgi:hypothetical protein
MERAPLSIEVSRRWRDDLVRWLASPAGQQPSRRFSGSALEAEVLLRLGEEAYGAGLPDEPLFPWLQRYAKAVGDLQRSRASTVVVSWQRSALELHLSRTGNTEALLSLHGTGASEEGSVWRQPIALAELREALATVVEELAEALESVGSSGLVTELRDWLLGLVAELETSGVAPPLSMLRGRRDPRLIEVSTSDAEGRCLTTTLRQLEPALLYAGESVAHGGALALGGFAMLSVPFGGSRRWEGSVLRRWLEVAEGLLRQAPDGYVSEGPTAAEADVKGALLVGDLASLLGEHLTGLAEALLREQPLLEVHPGFVALRATALSLRRHGSGRWLPVAARRQGAAKVAQPSVPATPVAVQGVAPERVRQMGYHRHWTVSVPPSSGRGGGTVWGDGAVAVTSPRGLEVTRLATGELAWRSEARARGRWCSTGNSLFGLGDGLLRRVDWRTGEEASSAWSIPSDRLAVAAPQPGGALVLSESGMLARWSDEGALLRWETATAVAGAGDLLVGRKSALVVGPAGEFVRVGLQRGSLSEALVLPWSVRTAARSGDQVWVEGYAGEAVLLGIDAESRSVRLPVEGEVAQVWEMADGRFGRLAEGEAGWLFEVWSGGGAIPERLCRLRLAAELAVGRNIVALRDGVVIAVRDGLIRFAVEGGAVAERWRRPLASSEPGGAVRLVFDRSESFIAELGETVVVRSLQTGRTLHTMAALWEQASEARLLEDGSLFVLEPAGRGGAVLHGLPAPGWLGLVG